MEEELASLSLLDEEEVAFQEEEGVIDQSFQFCLVGRCLTDSVVHFPFLCNTMADLWHPIGGICIIDLGYKQLMSESLAKQFGDFLGKFLDYDTSIPVLGPKTYMRIRVSLDVAGPLKRKKKIQVGGYLTVYACFKYEKLSLFCFICGKLGHGESYYPFRLKIEPSKIVYGWDLSSRTVPRRRTMVVSRWLREADGSQCHVENMGSPNQSINFNWEIDFGRDIGRDFGKQMSNPNLIPLGSNQQHLTKGNKNGRNLGKSISVVDGLVNGPMEMIVEEENDLIAGTEGKKRHRVVAGSFALLGNTTEGGSLDLMASSGEQSSRSQ
ncbi:hypothetical protein PVK06_029754 [Gossypium arboreum]|uniref:Zinc knuckle CX2CX4HX4C domain-containing protein n=1 Tax=Gossypium arboreum TaxID=29729 RepID=A0ABR0NLE3_GOSAR|nr:hypothetical protein PVK06_029754 [Gossypium arboreum]